MERLTRRIRRSGDGSFSFLDTAATVVFIVFIEFITKATARNTMSDFDWLTHRSAYHQKMAPIWESTMTVYRACLRELRDEKYLIQRESGEDRHQFRERLKLADFQPLFALVVDTYVGRVMESEQTITRRFQDEGASDGLGEISDKSTLAGKLWHGADGANLNYLTMLEDVAVLLLALKETWGIVQGVKRNDKGVVSGYPHIRVLEPWAIHDVVMDGPNPVEAKVFHRLDLRKSLKKEPSPVERYTLYMVDGFEVWEVSKNSGEDHRIVEQFRPYGVVDGKKFKYYRDEERRSGDEILPLFRTKLPLRRNPGETMADKNLVIFNNESERDNIIRVANTPKAQFVGDFKRFGEFLKENDAGSNVWPLAPDASREHKFLAPAMDSAEIATKVLLQKFETFMLTAFRYYEDSVRGKQKTATEVEQDSSAENSILSVTATGLDEFENAGGMRIEQAQFPNDPGKWGQFYVEREKKFKPINEREETDAIMKRYFSADGPVLTRDAEVALTKRSYNEDGFSIDDEQIEAEVDARRADRDADRTRKQNETKRSQTLLEADETDIERRRRQLEDQLVSA